MSNQIIYRGLKLESKKGCKYYSVVESDSIGLIEDTKTSTLKLTYTPKTTAREVSELLGIEKTDGDLELRPTNLPKRFNDVIFSLNSLKFKKLTSDPHTINIVIVDDSESRVVQDYYQTTIVVSKNDALDSKFVDFVFFSGNLKYITPIGRKPDNWSIRNFPKILIKDSNVDLTSDSTEIFYLRRRYDDYVIRAIDYQDQFILEIRRILDDYGVELVRANKEATLTKTSYITYQFSQTPSKISHPFIDEFDENIISQRIPVDFVLHTTDMVMFFDFKNKFNNVNLLTNFCEFKTTDKYGNRWTAAVKWAGGITEEFNHMYQPDDNSNFSYQCQFRCELYFYEVFDMRYKFLEDISATLMSQKNNES